MQARQWHISVPSASGGRSSSPRRLLSQCELLLQNSALVALPRPSAPQSTPPACAATAVAVPHLIRLLRRIPKTTHRTTSMPGTGGSPSPSHAPRSSPARPSSPMIFAPTAPPLPLAHGALLTRRINSRRRHTSAPHSRCDVSCRPHAQPASQPQLCSSCVHGSPLGHRNPRGRRRGATTNSARDAVGQTLVPSI
ncbi:hypothetical protein C8J57DRAFT_1580765 [Mycena rebaudengoi]|nr:hypothetical protein C8J57DRAFT_1580765 [Mycena rebaudengoi]